MILIRVLIIESYPMSWDVDAYLNPMSSSAYSQYPRIWSPDTIRDDGISSYFSIITDRFLYLLGEYTYSTSQLVIECPSKASQKKCIQLSPVFELHS